MTKVFCYKHLLLVVLLTCCFVTVKGQSAYQKELVKTMLPKMVLVEGGNFKCPDGYYHQNPSSRISVSSFNIARYEVTFGLWRAVIGVTYNDPVNAKCSDCPVNDIGYTTALLFIDSLNKITGRHYRLPTETEWVFAALGGNKTHCYKYAGSNNPDEVAWYDRNSERSVHPVGKKKPNELGLYDMSGNVAEWCSDWEDTHYFTTCPDKDPQGPAKGSYRITRGGGWRNDPQTCSPYVRGDGAPVAYEDNYVGFRLVLDK